MPGADVTWGKIKTMTISNDPVKALRAALTEKLHIDLTAHPIKVMMDGTSLSIEGSVEDIAKKKKALLIAMGLPGVSGVIDRLRVKPSMPMTDDEIKDHFYKAIAEEPTLKSGDIRGEVKAGVIDIEGTVGSLTHKRIAGVLAWWIPGTADVINSLEVVPPEADNEDEINDALRIVFEKDKLVDVSSLAYSNRDYVVTLEGAVCSDEEKHAAEEDAWYIWGVNDVINNIRLAPASVPHLP